MPIANNPSMLAAGFGPAARVASALGKSLSTIHRLCKGGAVQSTRDGAMLYVDLHSLRSYYAGLGNTALAATVKQLRDDMVREGKAAS